MATEIAKVADVNSTQPIGREIQIPKIMIIVSYVNLILSLFVWVITFPMSNSTDLFILTLLGAFFFAVLLFLETMRYFIHQFFEGKGSTIYDNPLLFTGLKVYYYICCTMICWNALKITNMSPNSSLLFIVTLSVTLAVFFFPVIVSRALARWKRLQKRFIEFSRESSGELDTKRSLF